MYIFSLLIFNEYCCVRVAFNLLDHTKSDTFGAEGLERALIDADTTPPSKEVLAALVAAADLNGDGELDFEEFQQMLKQVLF